MCGLQFCFAYLINICNDLHKNLFLNIMHKVASAYFTGGQMKYNRILLMIYICLLVPTKHYSLEVSLQILVGVQTKRLCYDIY